MKTNKVVLKRCSKCKKRKSITLFNKHKARMDGLQKSCRDCQAIEGAQCRRSLNGFILNTYGNMKKRVNGKSQERTRHLYMGKEIIPKDVFIQWARNNKHFLQLHKEWVINDYDYRLSPSINRINSNKGYTLDNIEWLTHSANSSLAGTVRRNKNKNKVIAYKVMGIGL